MLKNCKKCNVVFGTDDADTYLCEKCRTNSTLKGIGLRDKFTAKTVSKEILIKDFVRATPLASPQEVIMYMEQVDKPVSMSFISNMIKEGQIMLSEGVPEGSCFECGKAVSEGSLCMDCASMRRKRIERFAAPVADDTNSQNSPIMHTANNLRKRV